MKIKTTTNKKDMLQVFMSYLKEHDLQNFKNVENAFPTWNTLHSDLAYPRYEKGELDSAIETCISLVFTNARETHKNNTITWREA